VTLLRATTSVRVPFHDIDIMNIVWHGHYLKYFELARTALVQTIGFDWPEVKEWGLAMPVVDVSAQYKRPLQYNQEVTLIAECADPLIPAFDVNYEVRSADLSVLHATGRSRQVYIDTSTQAVAYALPPVVEAKFRAALLQAAKR